MTYLRRFVDEFFKRGLEPSVKRSPAGGWTVRIPVPIFATFTLTEREVMSGRLDMNGFLREVMARGEAALQAAIAQYNEAAEGGGAGGGGGQECLCTVRRDCPRHGCWG